MSESMEKWAKDTKQKKYVILVMILILLIILLTFYPFKSGNSGQGQVASAVQAQMQTSEKTSYEEKLEKRLMNMLVRMEGVGEVSVMVTLRATEEKILAQDTNSSSQKTEDKDLSGSTKVTEQTQLKNDVVLQSGNTPYVTKTYVPEVQGVFILAQGADNSQTKNQIIEAVSKLLDVPVHKISVEKKKN